MAKSKGQLEADISEALIKFEKEYMGRGPEQTKTYIIADMIVVRLQRVLTPAEQQLAGASDEMRGLTLIKQVRTELLEKARPLLERIITDLTGKSVKSLHTDISTATGERVIIFTLDSPVAFNSEKDL
ncbi:MAG: DUF2294 domain-containing protein [Sedimentisphaerales bacterium]|nr:DUF2294 domain-containing protein [Sedimentisphaerales bacterium]